MKIVTVLCLLWVAVVESQDPAWLNESCVDLLAVPVFNEEAAVYGIGNGSGLCRVEVQDVLNGGAGSNSTVCSACQPVVDLCDSIVGKLNQTVQNECVMAVSSPACVRAPHSYKAYGYGVAMLAVVLVLMTVLGFGLAKLGQRLQRKAVEGGEGKGVLSYKLLNLCLTALGASALMDNTVLHIIPQVLDIDASNAITLGKGCVLLVGLYAFYLLEFVLHSFTGHSHSHGGDEGDGDHGNSAPLEVTIPHGACKDDEPGSTIVHPRRGRDEDCTQQRYDSVPRDEKKAEESAGGEKEKTEAYFGSSVDDEEKPAVTEDVDCRPHSGHGHSHGGGDKGGACRGSPFLLLMVADTVHMFADGVALGASISHSLTLGLTTSCALLLHELPHVFGDYNILFRMRGGLMRTVVPFVAYMFLVAFAGYFTGASIGLHCAEANKWVLSLAAGFFVYVALVDLLPELINGVPRGIIRLRAILIIGLAFSVTFAIFTVLAVFQNSINVTL